MKTLVLGGARSGKSRFAEQQALEIAAGTQQQCLYFATGWAGDGEMANRIAHHKERRGDEWALIEEPVYLADALLTHDAPGNIILVDCLTLWLSNALHKDCFEQQRNKLEHALPALKSTLFFVSNEVGSGIVPLGALNRTFADEAGRLNQLLAQECDRVHLVVAGLPITLK